MFLFSYILSQRQAIRSGSGFFQFDALPADALHEGEDHDGADDRCHGADDVQRARAEMIQDDASGEARRHRARGHGDHEERLPADGFVRCHDLIDVADHRRQEDREAGKMEDDRYEHDKRSPRDHDHSGAEHVAQRRDLHQCIQREFAAQPREGEQPRDFEQRDDRIVQAHVAAPAADVLEHLEQEVVQDLMVEIQDEYADAEHEEQAVASEEFLHADLVLDRLCFLCLFLSPHVLRAVVSPGKDERPDEEEADCDLAFIREGPDPVDTEERSGEQAHDRVGQRPDAAADPVIHDDVPVGERDVHGIQKRLQARVDRIEYDVGDEHDDGTAVQHDREQLEPHDGDAHDFDDFQHREVFRSVDEVRRDRLDDHGQKIRECDEDPDLGVRVAVPEEERRAEARDDAVRHPVRTEHL